MRELRVDDLRHTFGSLLVAANVDLVTVQAQLGHARLETTAR
jgi:integrase